MKYIKIAFSSILIIFVFLLCGCEKSDNGDFGGVSFPVTVDGDIIIEDGFLYSGIFPEDGQNDEKKNVPALKVKNNSDKALQLIRIYAETDEKNLLFEITTLPAGATVTVLEKNAQTLSEKDSINQFSAENRINFEKELTLHSDVFTLTELNGIFNIRNNTDTDIAADIYVYYKKKNSDGSYFGGITFRTKAEGLAANELKQLSASHFDPKDSEVLFIEYAEE